MNDFNPPIRTVCAWCQAVLVDGPPAPVSHGICLACESTWDAPAVEADASLLAHHEAYLLSPELALR